MSSPRKSIFPLKPCEATKKKDYELDKFYNMIDRCSKLREEWKEVLNEANVEYNLDPSLLTSIDGSSTISIGDMPDASLANISRSLSTRYPVTSKNKKFMSTPKYQER